MGLVVVDKGHGVKVRLRFGRRRLAGSGSLDLGALHLECEKVAATKKKLVVVSALVAALRDSTESIQVELPLKACKLGLAKATRQALFDKVIVLLYNKGTAAGEEERRRGLEGKYTRRHSSTLLTQNTTH